jgi:hypothetical protein
MVDQAGQCLQSVFIIIFTNFIEKQLAKLQNVGIRNKHRNFIEHLRNEKLLPIVFLHYINQYF